MLSEIKQTTKLFEIAIKMSDRRSYRLLCDYRFIMFDIGQRRNTPVNMKTDILEQKL